MKGKARDIPFALILLGFLALLYARGLNAPLTYDDRAYLVDNGFSKNLRNLPALLSSRYFAGTGKPRYRPVSALGYFAGYSLAGLNPVPRRLLRLLLLSANAFIVFRLGRRLKLGKWESLGAGLFFALHPAGAENFIILSFNDDPLCFLFLGLALLSATGDRPGKGWRAGFFYLAALLSKETALLFLPLIGAGIAAGIPQGKAIRPSSWGLWGTITGAYLLVRFLLLPGKTTLVATPPAWVERGPFAAQALLANLSRLFFPVGLSLDYSWPQPGLAWNLPAAPALGLALAALAFLSLFLLSRKLRFAAAWLLLGLLPASHLLPLPQLTADRYLYLPLAGLAWLLAGLISSWRRRAGASALAGIIACFGLLTLNRMPAWLEPGAIWIEALERSPASVTAAYNLGSIRLAQGRVKEAESLYQRGLGQVRTPAQAARGLTGLAEISRRRGKKFLAAALAGKAVEFDPGFSRPRLLLAYLALQERRLEEAGSQLQTVLAENPFEYEAWGLLGAVRAEEGDYAHARRLMLRALELNPDYREGRKNLAVLDALSSRGEKR